MIKTAKGRLPGSCSRFSSIGPRPKGEGWWWGRDLGSLGHLLSYIWSLSQQHNNPHFCLLWVFCHSASQFLSWRRWSNFVGINQSSFPPNPADHVLWVQETFSQEAITHPRLQAQVLLSTEDNINVWGSKLREPMFSSIYCKKQAFSFFF